MKKNLEKRKFNHIKIINKSSDELENPTKGTPHLASNCGWDVHEDPNCDESLDNCTIDYAPNHLYSN